MKKLVFISIMLLFNFKTIGQNKHLEIQVSQNEWEIVNDNVMGGVSTGDFKTQNNELIFFGKLSSKFNGGFASIRTRERIQLNNSKKINLRVIGDGNTYQIRIKDNSSNYYSYQQEFETNGLEQEITLSLSEFKPIYRGTYLSTENFDKKFISELSFMIVSKKEPDFKLKIIEIIID
tara:strand:- start:8630 stop:9160 length:531 start_codon:yes stop_codon:yes gene_type:complete